MSNKPYCACGCSSFGSQGRDLICENCLSLVDHFQEVTNDQEARDILEQLGWEGFGSIKRNKLKKTEFYLGGQLLALYDAKMKTLTINR
jgi:hypothetical protein